VRVAVDDRQRDVVLHRPGGHVGRLPSVVYGENVGGLGQRPDRRREARRLPGEGGDVGVDRRVVGERVAAAVDAHPVHGHEVVGEHRVAGPRERRHRRPVLMVAADHEHRGAGGVEPLDEVPRLVPAAEVRHVAGEDHGVDRRPLTGGQPRGEPDAVGVHMDVARHQQPRDGLARRARVPAGDLPGHRLKAVDVRLQTRHAAAVGALELTDERQQARHMTRQAAVLDGRRLVDRRQRDAGHRPAGDHRHDETGDDADRRASPAAQTRAPPRNGERDQCPAGGAKHSEGDEPAPEEAGEGGAGTLLDPAEPLDDVLGLGDGGDVAGHPVLDDDIERRAERPQRERPRRTERKDEAAARPCGSQAEVHRPGRHPEGDGQEKGHARHDDHDEQRDGQHDAHDGTPAGSSSR